MLEFSIKTPSGTETLNSQELLQQYGQFTGMQPVGLSQDGASGIYQTPQGMQTIPFHEVLQQVGAEISDYKPKNAIPAENMLKYRMALDNISDPDVQQAYFKTVATKDFGIENPLILRSGTDTFLWDSGKGSWVSLTNQPGLDTSDVLSGAGSLAKGALSVGGGALGALGAGALGLPSGPGAVATAALGAGAGASLGSMVGDAASAGIMGLVDPNFRKNYDIGTEGRIMGDRALISGALGAAGPVAGAVLPGVMRAGQALRPSSIAGGVSAGVRGAGQVVGAVGQSLDTELGRAAMQVGLDPTGLSGIGAMAGLAREYAPKMAQGIATGATKARDFYSQMAGKPIASAPIEAQGLKNFAQGLGVVGGGLEKVGVGVENAIIGGTKGIGAGLRGAGTAGQYGAQGMRALEAPAAYAGARSLPGGAPSWANVPQQEDRILQTGLDARSPGGLQVMQTGSPSLADAIAARGGIYNVLR